MPALQQDVWGKERENSVLSQPRPIMLLCSEPQPIETEDGLKIDKYYSKAEKGLLEISPIFVLSR